MLVWNQQTKGMNSAHQTMDTTTETFEDVPLVEFIYHVFTRMLGEVTIGDSVVFCCALCLMRTINSLLFDS